MNQRQFEAVIQKSNLLASVFQSWDNIKLNDCWLVAGCVAQTVWNEKFDLPSNFGISDIDLVYFDPDDLSAEGEQQHAERIRRHFDDLPVWFDVKNEARVHLWYQEKFGYSIDQYQTIKAAISTFPTTATSVGVRPQAAGLELYTPFGLDDLVGGIVRPNKSQITKEIFDTKVIKWLKNWPDLTIVKWDD